MAPAFEAALYAGLRLAGPADGLAEPAARFSRHLGVAFQVLNDLDDWKAEAANKRQCGTDVLGGRPTILWALALENLAGEDRARLEALVARPGDPAETVEAVRQWYEQAGVFAQARLLVARHRERAIAVAEGVRPEALGHLLHYLADAILRG